MEITGVVKVIYEEQRISERFSKRDFVITESSSQYPQHIIIQLTNAKCSILDDVCEGDTVLVQVNLQGREWKSPTGEIKYFNTINAWKIEIIKRGDLDDTNDIAPRNSVENSSFVSGESDDLPF